MYCPYFETEMNICSHELHGGSVHVNEPLLRMACIWLLPRVALAKTDVSGESIIYAYVFCNVLHLLFTDNDVPMSLILVTLMLEATCSSETLVLTRTSWCNIQEDVILHGYRRENFKPYIQICSQFPRYNSSSI
jgi:hypothetical protein